MFMSSLSAASPGYGGIRNTRQSNAHTENTPTQKTYLLSFSYTYAKLTFTLIIQKLKSKEEEDEYMCEVQPASCGLPPFAAASPSFAVWWCQHQGVCVFVCVCVSVCESVCLCEYVGRCVCMCADVYSPSQLCAPLSTAFSV